MTCDFDELNGEMEQKCAALSIVPARIALLVSIPAQQMALQVDGKTEQVYAISTSLKPPSCRENSFGTPHGLHEIADRIGAGEPAGMVFKGRAATGRRFQEYPQEVQRANLITSRILRLTGLEPGVNRGPGVDSYDRYIYIHGTNHENRIGRPFSGGCIEMCNAEVIALFERLGTHPAHVWIKENTL